VGGEPHLRERSIEGVCMSEQRLGLLLKDQVAAVTEAQPDWRQTLARQASKTVTALKAATEIAEDVAMLEKVGCPAISIEQAAQAGSQERCRRSLAYIGWLLKLTGSVDRTQDSRAVVNRGRILYFAAGGDLGRARRVMRKPISADSPVSSESLLVLGEIDRAFDHAMRRLPGPAGEMARADERHNLYVDDTQPVHLTPQRVRLLARPDADQRLGPNVAANMRKHIEGCDFCSESPTP